MKINRLLEITILLLNKNTVTAGELAERFGVSTRTIYRDVDVLSSAGVPVYTSKGNRGGISLMEDYALNRALISEAEKDGLRLALQTLQATKYPEAEAVLRKLGGVFRPASSLDLIQIDFTPWGSDPNEHEKFGELRCALLERRVVRFQYINAEGERSERLFEPMKLVFKGQAWYIWGFCRMRQDFRTFRVTRIKGLVLTAERFEPRKVPPEPMKPPPPPDAFVNLRLRFSPQAMHRIYDDFGDTLIERTEDGGCYLSVCFPEDEWVYGYLMSFGPYVSVLSPEYARQKLIARLRAALAQYDPPQADA